MHAHTRDCPLTCLKPTLSAGAYFPLHRQCSSRASGPHPSIGDAVDLYHKEQLAAIRGIGVKRFREIEGCLTRAGLIGQAARPDTQPQAPASDGQPPPLPSGWSGSTRPSRLRTRLLVE
jgi:hypothetical protein